MSTDVALPEPLLVFIAQEFGEAEIPSYVERAARAIMETDASGRMAMMMAVLDIGIDSYRTVSCTFTGEGISEFLSYCREMKLRSEVLLAGALMTQFGLRELPATLPSFDEVCSHRTW